MMTWFLDAGELVFLMDNAFPVDVCYLHVYWAGNKACYDVPAFDL
ncbi:hypothetical protein A2U01_0058752, partial [Trifolium medium]|nr:hypothetical protein [Trifolium medium]